MAYMLARFEVDDYDTWKRERFDADPAGRAETAKGYMLFRGADDPSQVFVAVEFASVEEAKSFRERLLASGVLDTAGMTVVAPPTVVEVADQVEY
jgi:hypothetical protein